MTSAKVMFLILVTIFVNVLSCKGAFLDLRDDDAPVTPVVLWHGMGDGCCFSFSLGAIEEQLKESLPGVYTRSLQVGDSLITDVTNGYLLHPDKQINLVCEMIKNDTALSNGFNALGFSQGGQFLRALVQRCPEAKIKNLVSIGGQHQGVYGLPNCAALRAELCDYIRKLLNEAAYLDWVQNGLVQATYWHDPLNEEEYKNYSTFLSDINNEQRVNSDYVERLQSLENFILIKFEGDTIVQPVETEWFGFYEPGQSEKLQSLQESSLYLNDRLGLSKMDGEGKLHFLSTPGNHLKFEWTWFEENVITPFLKS